MTASGEWTPQDKQRRGGSKQTPARRKWDPVDTSREPVERESEQWVTLQGHKEKEQWNCSVKNTSKYANERVLFREVNINSVIVSRKKVVKEMQTTVEQVLSVRG